MRRALILVLALLFASCAPLWAASASSAVYNMQATVPDDITISVKWFDTNGDPVDEIFGTTIDYGNLVLDGANHVYNNNKAKLALITLSNHSRAYEGTWTGTTLTKGGDTIPNSSYQAAIAYVAGDNGGAVNEGTLGTNGNAAQTAEPFYTSGGTHALRVIRVYYSIVNVPEDQAVGTYAGTMTFTNTAL